MSNLLWLANKNNILFEFFYPYNTSQNTLCRMNKECLTELAFERIYKPLCDRCKFTYKENQLLCKDMLQTFDMFPCSVVLNFKYSFCLILSCKVAKTVSTQTKFVTVR